MTEVYRIHVKQQNKSEEKDLEAFVKADNAGEAIQKLLKECPGLIEFGQISINNIPNSIIII